MKQSKFSRKVIGYIRVSTVDQDTEKNESAILKFANAKEFGKVEFINEKISGMQSWKKRKLFNVVQNLNPGDVLIVPELSRLGRSLKDILDILNKLSDKDVKVYSVKENFQLIGEDMKSKVMRTMLALFSEIEHDLIVSRTKEGLEAARAKGKLLGRPKGPGKSRLDEHRQEIINMLENGVTRKYIATLYGMTPASLTNWLSRHELSNTKPKYNKP